MPSSQTVVEVDMQSNDNYGENELADRSVVVLRLSSRDATPLMQINR